MDMIFIGGGVIVVLALVSVFVLKAKHRPGSVHGDFRFDFDGYKTSELNRRGLLDRTRWQ